MPSPFSNNIFPAQLFTATSQMSPAIALGTKQANGQWTSGSWSAAAISLAAAAAGAYTATFGMLGSSDGGVTFNAIAIASAAVPGTFATTFTTTGTTTGTAAYHANLAGLTHVKFVTSGSFTATSLAVTMTASPNAS